MDKLPEIGTCTCVTLMRAKKGINMKYFYVYLTNKSVCQTKTDLGLKTPHFDENQVSNVSHELLAS